MGKCSCFEEKKDYAFLIRMGFKFSNISGCNNNILFNPSIKIYTFDGCHSRVWKKSKLACLWSTIQWCCCLSLYIIDFGNGL